MNNANANQQPHPRIEEALHLHRSDNFEEARVIYESILQEEPENWNALQLLGLLNAQTGNATSAIEHLQNSLNLHPRQPATLFNMGKLLNSEMRYEEAQPYLEEALNIQPDYPQAAMALAKSLAKQGKVDNAAEKLRDTLRYQPQNQAAKIQLGALYLTTKNYQQAINCFDAVIKAEPQNMKALYNRGMAYANLHDYTKAKSDYLSLIEIEPSHLQALINLAVIAKEEERFDEARDYIQSALKIDPNNINAINNSGAIEHAAGKWEKAEKIYLKLLETHPNFAPTWHNLGLSYQFDGKLEKAEEAYRKVITIDESQTFTHYNLGFVLEKMERIEEALDEYKIVLKRWPKFTDAHIRTAYCLHAIERSEEALEHANIAASTAPEDIDALLVKTTLLAHMKQYSDALSLINKALDIDPDNPFLLTTLGNIYIDIRQYDNALKTFEKALSIDNQIADARNGMGTVLMVKGEMEKARECFREAIKIKADFFPSYRHLTLVEKLLRDDPVVAKMESYFSDETLPPKSIAQLGFSLFSVYHRAKLFDKAIDALHRANAARKKRYPNYSSEEQTKYFDKFSSLFTPEFFSNNPTSKNEDSTPIFILGMPRSGSTLIEQILSSHPQIMGGDELFIMHKLALDETVRLSDKSFPESLVNLTPENLELLGKSYVYNLKESIGDAPHITDKMPSNFQYVGLIHQMLPKAKIIHTKRHPIDTAWSIYKHFFSGTQPFAYSLEDIGHYYNAYAKMMKHWETVLPGVMHTINLEEIVENQEEETRKLLEFCNLEWHDDCLNFHKTEREVATASLQQVRQPLYKNKNYAWEAYRKDLEPLAKIIGVPLP